MYEFSILDAILDRDNLNDGYEWMDNHFV